MNQMDHDDGDLRWMMKICGSSPEIVRLGVQLNMWLENRYDK